MSGKALLMRLGKIGKRTRVQARSDRSEVPSSLQARTILSRGYFASRSSGIELYADTTRNTGALDPYRREQHIALGCASENLMLAADANGYNASATRFLELSMEILAIRFSWSPVWSSLRACDRIMSFTTPFRTDTRTETLTIRKD